MQQRMAACQTSLSFSLSLSRRASAHVGSSNFWWVRLALLGASHVLLSLFSCVFFSLYFYFIFFQWPSLGLVWHIVYLLCWLLFCREVPLSSSDIRRGRRRPDHSFLDRLQLSIGGQDRPKPSLMRTCQSFQSANPIGNPIAWRAAATF